MTIDIQHCIYYKKSSRLYEQSLDIYRPSHPSNTVVVLVVGSAWLGHQPIFYRGTAWWNASGPRTVASQGHTCVCIRHRGAFPKLGFVSGIVSVTVGGIVTAIAQQMTVLPYPSFTALGLSLLVLMLIWMGGRNDATLPDMWDDVTDALVWLQKSDLLHEKQFIFGGYSSGGHVAATLLHRPHLWRAKGLELTRLDGVLYLSAVLAVEQWNDHSMWLANLIRTTVFGNAVLPTPLHEVQSGQRAPPKIPHLLIGCRHEVFGLPYMDVLFASAPYAQQVGGKYVAVESDHWRVLNSRALAEALRMHMDVFGKKE